MTSPGTGLRRAVFPEDRISVFLAYRRFQAFHPKLAVSPVDGGLLGVQEARCWYGYGYADRITGPGLLGQVL